VQQHHGALLGVGHLVGRLQPGKRAFGDDHRVALAEKWLGGLGQLAVAQQVNQGVFHLGGPGAKAHQLAHPQGGANGRPAGAVVAGAKPHKQVARKHGLAHHFGLAAADFFNAQQRQVAGVALALQVDQRDVLLPGLGVDQVPGGDVRGGGA